MVIIHSFFIVEMERVQLDQIFKYSKLSKTKTLTIYAPDNDSNQWFYKKYMELERFIPTIDGVKAMGSYFETSVTPYGFNKHKNYIELNRKLYKNTIKEEMANVTTTLYLDAGSHSLTKFHMQSGRNFTSSDFTTLSRNNIPILVGANYEDIFPVGSTFKADWYDGEKLEYKVIGILNNDNKWLSAGGYVSDLGFKLDNMFVTLMTDKQKFGTPLDVVVRIQSTFIQLEGDADNEVIKRQIKDKANELHLVTPTLNTVQQDIDVYQENVRDLLRINLFSATFFLFISIIGMITVSLSSINERMYEIGIKRTIGYSILDIIMMIVTELFMLIFVSATLAWTIFYQYKINSSAATFMPVADTLNAHLFMNFTITGVFIVLLTFILPIIKLNRLEPTQFIRNKE